jgi:hypothetical protein
MDKNKLYYVAGPISGQPNFNVHAFEAAAKLLQERGYIAVTPFEINNLQHRQGITETREQRIDYMRNDIRCLIDECRGIILLPGWSQSKGARLEMEIAKALDYEIRFLTPEGEIV